MEAEIAAMRAQDEEAFLALTRCYSLEFGGPFVRLDEIFVLPEARGAGVGRRLLDTAAQYCREAGAAYLRLEVQKKIARSVDLYRAYGFRTEDRFLMSLDVSKGGVRRCPLLSSRPLSETIPFSRFLPRGFSFRSQRQRPPTP